MPSADRIATLLLTYRYPLALLSLMLAVLAASGAGRLVFENDYKLFFSDDDPHLVAHEKMEEAYTRSDNLAFLIGVDEGDLFTPQRLAAIAALTERLWAFERVIRVDSLTNFQHTEAAGDDLEVYPLFEHPQQLSAAELERRREIALAEVSLVNRLVAADGRATMVNARLQMPDGSSVERGAATQEVMRAARALRDEFQARHPDMVMHLLGVPAIDQAFNDSTVKDMRTLVPAMFGVIVLLCALLLRSLMAMLAALTVILLTLPATMGTVGWLGFALNQVNVVTPTIVMTLCICDAIHILVSHRQLMRRGMAREAAMHKALAINLQPVFLTSVTTAIGFLCLNFSDSPPFRELGTFVAIGVMYAWLFSMTALPALLGWIRVKPKPGQTGFGLDGLADFVLSRRRPLFWGGLALAALLIAFAPRNELTDSTYQYFDPGVPIRDAADFLENRLGGFDQVAFSLPAGEPGGVTDPDYLARLEAFADWAWQQPHVAHVSHFAQVMKRLNRDMHGGDPAYYRVPAERDLAAQYLLLYELSLPFGLDLNDQLTFDKSATRFEVTLRGVKARQIVEFERRARQWLETHTPQMAVPGSSVSVMFAHIGQNNIYSMLLGSLVALIGISLTLTLTLKSWKLGLLSLVPNAFPALLAFGLWGIFVAEVNLAVAAIFSVTLGIVVDDTVHFLSKYLRARREHHDSAETAVRYAFGTVGAALMVTTTILGLGFLLLALSDFQVNALTGLLTATTITIALVYDLLFLPTLLLRCDRWLGLEQGHAPAI